jgi:YD repeat-containing protein
MRQVLLLAFLFFTANSCRHDTKSISKVTVIIYVNENSGFFASIDTLLNKEQLHLEKNPVDLFFCHTNFKIPYYIPTDGIYRNAAKDKESDWNSYPNTVKCYEYDNQNRVIRMKVDGSGTMNDFTYQYNDKNQITGLKDYESDIYKLTYNNNGTLAELTRQNTVSTTRLVFIYH